jgi:hypothetical protein
MIKKVNKDFANYKIATCLQLMGGSLQIHSKSLKFV